MGMAVGHQSWVIGSQHSVTAYRNQPQVALKNKWDACYLPRQKHYTGYIDCHDVAFGKRGVHLVATSLSAVCTLDPNYSVKPIWVPPWVTDVVPDDRCHLNGLAMCQGELAFVTALGRTEKWRENRHDGIVFDVRKNEFITAGLSYPHSPRYHQGRLYYLESGRGRFVAATDTGRDEEICRLPGFLRGLDFIGDTAYIGLSEAREKAFFKGIRLEKTMCGVAAVDMKTGQYEIFPIKRPVTELFSVNVIPYDAAVILHPHSREMGYGLTLPGDTKVKVA